MLKRAILLSLFVPELLATINFYPNAGTQSLDILKKQRKDGTCYFGESVHLSGMKINEISKNFIISNAIESINLDHNLIKHVPENTFDSIPNLHCINLAHNFIPFNEIMKFRHNSLRTLIMDNQTIVATEVYDMIEDVKRLNVLKAEIPNLENLHLNGVYFEHFPHYFKTLLPRLMSLYLANNHLSFINGSFIEKLPRSLINLHLEENSLEYINLQNLGNIKALYLDHNPLKFINLAEPAYHIELLSLSGSAPGDISYVTIFPNLRSLDLSSNNIVVFTPSFAQGTPYLENLSLENNNLQNFPELYMLTNLRSLSLSYNSIIALMEPIRLPNLIKLSLRGNLIKTVSPVAFLELVSLKELDLSENMLTSLPVNWTDNLKMLRYINLRSNRFASIEDMSVNSLPNMQELYVQGNQFMNISLSQHQLLSPACMIYVG